MKVAFSTLGCPDWTWNDVVSTAKDLGYDGIEIRGIGSELHAPDILEFSDENIDNTLERLNKLGLEIPCLTSSCFLFEKDRAEINLKEGREYVDLAQKLGVPFVRMLGDRNPEPGEKIDFHTVKENISELASYSDGKGVKVLIETNGFFADPAQILKLLDAVGSGNLGVLWDIHHPYRFMNVSADEAYKALKDHICHVHMKDSVVQNGKIKYKMLGHGDVPVFEALNLLMEDGYKGYVSLEWVKRWLSDLEEPGVVFSHFISRIRRAIGK
ncbi:MAG TPA: sugar phosphate isomerase/epimerase [Clostridiaceae bacterium]|nr:sugar phosphate isomerase/epimerase [Clostridiaceae bacterium]